MLEYEGIYFEVVIQTENGLYRRTVRTVSTIIPTLRGIIIFCGTLLATRDAHRQFKAASSPYYPHAKEQFFAFHFLSFCCCSFLACFFLGGSFFSCFLIGR